MIDTKINKKINLILILSNNNNFNLSFVKNKKNIKSMHMFYFSCYRTNKIIYCIFKNIKILK